LQGVIIIKRIAVVTTGGTIAMKADHTGLASPSLSGDDLIAAIPSLKKRAAVDVFAFCNVPSSYITMDHLVRLRNYIDQLGEQGYAGVVVTHGTDTMEETAYFLDLTMQSSIPVVLTGAQRNPSLVSSDGPANLLDSILVAADDRAHEMGVLIVFASEIVAAREATKFHRTRVAKLASITASMPKQNLLGFCIIRKPAIPRSSILSPSLRYFSIIKSTPAAGPPRYSPGIIP
jgi:L-asparaginase